MDRAPSSDESIDNSRQARRRRRGAPQGGQDAGALQGLGGPTQALSGTVGQAGGLVSGLTGGLTGGQQQAGGGKSDTLKLRLDLNLDVEVSIKAKVHGDVTLSLL